MAKNTDKAQKAVKKARKLLNPLGNLQCLPAGGIVTSSSGETFSMECSWASSLPQEMTNWIFDLFRRNMREMYMASQWGYDEHSKHQELEATTARFLILRNSENVAIGYSHFRFVVENEEPVLYCYEIQLEKEYQGQGLGTHLLNALEVMALKSSMNKVMATVFTYNKQSLGFFYKHGYQVDNFSPDAAQNLDYLILSKECANNVLKSVDN